MLSASSFCNLPGWRWAAITKVALDRLSRSLHSDVCDSDGCCDAVVHSTISGSGNRRTRAVPNNAKEILEGSIQISEVLEKNLPVKGLMALMLGGFLTHVGYEAALLFRASLRKGQ